MRRVGHVASMGEMRNALKVAPGKPTGSVFLTKYLMILIMFQRLNYKVPKCLTLYG